jgi:hypothetical protein
VKISLCDNGPCSWVALFIASIIGLVSCGRNNPITGKPESNRSGPEPTPANDAETAAIQKVGVRHLFTAPHIDEGTAVEYDPVSDQLFVVDNGHSEKKMIIWDMKNRTQSSMVIGDVEQIYGMRLNKKDRILSILDTYRGKILHYQLGAGLPTISGSQIVQEMVNDIVYDTSGYGFYAISGKYISEQSYDSVNYYYHDGSKTVIDSLSMGSRIQYGFERSIDLTPNGDLLILNHVPTDRGNGQPEYQVWSAQGKLLQRFKPERPYYGSVVRVDSKNRAYMFSSSTENFRRLDLASGKESEFAFDRSRFPLACAGGEIGMYTLREDEFGVGVIYGPYRRRENNKFCEVWIPERRPGMCTPKTQVGELVSCPSEIANATTAAKARICSDKGDYVDFGPCKATACSSNLVPSTSGNSCTVCRLGQDIPPVSCVSDIPGSEVATKTIACNSRESGFVYGDCVLEKCGAGLTRSGNSCLNDKISRLTAAFAVYKYDGETLTASTSGITVKVNSTTRIAIEGAVSFVYDETTYESGDGDFTTPSYAQDNHQDYVWSVTGGQLNRTGLVDGFSYNYVAPSSPGTYKLKVVLVKPFKAGWPPNEVDITKAVQMVAGTAFTKEFTITVTAQ